MRKQIRFGVVVALVAASLLVAGAGIAAGPPISPLTGEADTTFFNRAAVEVALPTAPEETVPALVPWGLYGSDGQSLYLIDKNTGAATFIGSHGIAPANIGALAFQEGGTLYGIDLGNASTLYTIDTGTGAATPVGALGIGFVFEGGLDFGPQGRLFGVDQGDANNARTFIVNPVTGAATILGPAGGDDRDLNGLAFDGPTLYAIDRVTNSLGRVSTATGGYTPIGNVGANILVGDTGGLAIDPLGGTLYATFGGTGGFYTLNKATGAATLVAFNGIDFGLAFAPGWTTAYAELFDKRSDLELARQYRDDLLAKSEAGSLYTHLLYQSSEEALQVLLDHPELMAQARRLHEVNKDAVAAVLDGRVATLRGTEEIISFLDAFAGEAPSSLQVLTRLVRRDLMAKQRSGEIFLGFQLQ